MAGNEATAGSAGEMLRVSVRRARALVWLVAGIAAAAFTVMREIGSLLSRIVDENGVGYGVGITTDFQIAFFDTNDLAAALRLWTVKPDDGGAMVTSQVDLATSLAQWHVLADLVFIPAFTVILWQVLTRVGAGRSFAIGAPLAYAVADLSETALFGLAITTMSADNRPLLVVLQLFSLVKWLALGVVLVGGLVNLARDDPAPAAKGEGDGGAKPGTKETQATSKTSLSARGLARGVQRARNAERLDPSVAVTGQFVIVAIFVILIALPGGSALGQAPDVLRVQIDPLIAGGGLEEARSFLLSVPTLLLFALSAVTSAAIGGPRSRLDKKTIGSAIPLVGAAIVSIVLAIMGLVVDGSLAPSPWSPLIIAIAIALGGWIATLAAGDRNEPATRNPPAPPDAAGANTAATKAQTAATTTETPTTTITAAESTLAATTAATTESEAALEPNSVIGSKGLNQWASALAALVIIASGLGLLRAAVPIALLPDNSRWWLATAAFGALVIVGGGVAADWILRMGLVTKLVGGRQGIRRAIAVFVVVTVVLLAGWLAVDPSSARHWGSTGTVAIAFSFYVLLVGGLQRLSRRARPWRATQRLGLGVNTPWAAILVATWVIGSLLNSQAGYHEIQVTERALPAQTITEGAVEADDRTAAAQHGSITGAFADWVDANRTSACGDTAGGGGAELRAEIPLVMVAAPGGGIRAAYWTGTTLEQLLPGECRDRLFVASGASGGAVGISIWASNTTPDRADPPTDERASTTRSLDAMSDDDALASTVAALLLRDLPQPLTGLREAWDDRGAVLESRWTAVTAEATASPADLASDGPLDGGPFGGPESPRPTAELGPNRDGWAPIVVLNSSSVVDGCRALIATVDGLPIAENGDCLSSDTSNRGSTAAPGRAAIDVLDRLIADDEECPAAASADIDDRGADLALVSSALLAARWPYVTPSGSIEYCVGDDRRDLYLVDGGYFENTGILAVLEIWQQLEPLVDQHNATDGEPKIVPWILFLDNSYQATAPPSAGGGRPPELLVPVRTFFRNNVTGSAALQQQAAAEMADVIIDRPPEDSSPDDASPDDASPDDALPEDLVATLREPTPGCATAGFARVGPIASPDVAAPLGWVLSEVSRRSLDRNRDEALGGPCVADLVAHLVPVEAGS